LQAQFKENLAVILSKLSLDFDQSLSLASNQEFLALINSLNIWIERLLKKNPEAVLDVSVNLMPLLKEKKWQNLAFDLFAVLIESRLKGCLDHGSDNVRLSKLLEKNFQAQKKWQSNVSLLWVWEQLAVNTIWRERNFHGNNWYSLSKY
jgi:hypothetical protein